MSEILSYICLVLKKKTNKTMSKNTKTYNTYNKDIIRRLKKKYGLTSVFIYASLRGERNSETSIKICEDYKAAEKEIIKTLQKI